MAELRGSYPNGRHWTNLLRCPVCFSYFQEPVTLNCGHTFCYGCMLRIVRILRMNNQAMGFVGPHRQKLWCPTCRNDVSTRMFLRNRVNISFVIRDLVEGWRNERHNLAELWQTMLRSTSTQTTTPNLAPSGEDDHVSKDEWFLQPKPDICIEAAIQSADSEMVCGYPNDNHARSHRQTASEYIHELNVDESDGAESQDDGNVAPHHEWAPWKTMLVVAWATYSFAIIMLAQTYLPDILLYSLLFMSILYTERLPNRPFI